MTINIGINTIQDMQAAVLGDTICVVCNDNTEPMDSGETSGFMSATSTGSGWTIKYSGINTLSCPAIVSWNGLFQAFYADGNGEINHAISSDGLNWNWHDNTGLYTTVGSWETSPSGGVSAVTDGSVLHLFYRDPGGGGVLHTQWNPGASSWAPSVYIGINAERGMSAAVLGQIVCVVCVDNNPVEGNYYAQKLMWATLSPGGAWQTGACGFEAMYDPGICAHTGKFLVYYGYSGVNVQAQIYEIMSTDGQTWDLGAAVPAATSGGCFPLVVPPDDFMLFWRDPGGGAVQTQGPS